MFQKHYWSIDSKIIHLVTMHPASQKIECLDSCFFSYLQLVHSFTRIKETAIITEHCGTPWMDQLTVCTPFLFAPKDPWAVSSSMLTINQSLKFSISTPTYKLEMHLSWKRRHFWCLQKLILKTSLLCHPNVSAQHSRHVANIMTLSFFSRHMSCRVFHCRHVVR